MYYHDLASLCSATWKKTLCILHMQTWWQRYPSKPLSRKRKSCKSFETFPRVCRAAQKTRRRKKKRGKKRPLRYAVTTRELANRDRESKHPRRSNLSLTLCCLRCFPCQEKEMEKQKILYQQARLHARGAAEMVLQMISASKGNQVTIFSLIWSSLKHIQNVKTLHFIGLYGPECNRKAVWLFCYPTYWCTIIPVNYAAGNAGIYFFCGLSWVGLRGQQSHQRQPDFSGRSHLLRLIRLDPRWSQPRHITCHPKQTPKPPQLTLL